MWDSGWRERVWSALDTQWDLVVVGGGITGAGILREAARAGLKVLLVEGKDFASGTSSRSSKLVHGGLRYLKNFQFKLTYESVRERERLLHEGRGLVNPLGFLLPSFKFDALPGWIFGAGLAFYDLIALKWGHRHYDAIDIQELCPHISCDGLLGGYRYFDAQTDDARLVLRLIREAVRSGGQAINYACVSRLLRGKSGEVCGIVLEDHAPESYGRALEIQAQVVINATGAWADDLRLQMGGRSRLRKLRGSHLVFPAQRLPLTRAVNFLHPDDGRPVFAVPWEGVTLVGTTDVDHGQLLPSDPSISPQEAEYLLKAVQRGFPELELDLDSVQATFSGVRPVIGTGKKDPSKESREHVLWYENGLLTVAGGKLTTFRRMARDALRMAGAHLQAKQRQRLAQVMDNHVLDPIPPESTLEPSLKGSTRLRLLGRYGSEARAAVETAEPGELEAIPGTPALWSELRWAARSEGVVHLDDLLMRRVRLGLLLPQGGVPVMERIRAIVQKELGWSDSRWRREVASYANLWKRCYDIPPA